MKITYVNRWIDTLKLFRFLFWYLLGITAVFYFLPRIGVFLEGKLDGLASAVKISSVICLFLVTVIWHLASQNKKAVKHYLPAGTHKSVS